MKCRDCPLKYIGQTGRIFNIRHEEHIHAIRNNSRNSGYSNHILNTGHTYGTLMDAIKTGRKANISNILEQYHIYRTSKDDLHINDTQMGTTLYWYMAETRSGREVGQDNKLHLRWKYMYTRISKYINATGCLNTIFV
jgi:hypothetical protein